MFLALNKRFLWLIVIWFALLQVASPFIHAHIEADSPAQGHGLHMHISGLMQAQDHVHTLKNISTNMHTIGVDTALVKSIESLPLPLFAVLFVICLPALARKQFNYSYISHLHIFPSLRSISRPRAPPLF